MTLLLADRFLADGPSWIDAATGEAVRVRVTDAGAAGAQLAWADWCASLALLRHPLLNPLVDYGSCDASRRFECYARRPALRAGGRSGSALIAHAVRFLESHGIPLHAPLADLAMRQVTMGARLRGRPIGVVLRRRAALDAIIGVLDGHAPPGAVTVFISGAPGSGLSTLKLFAAREARIRGYVPICAAVLCRWPALAEDLLLRHLCLLIDDQLPRVPQQAFAAFMTKLATASARRHVVLRWQYSVDAIPSAVRLEPIGVAAMTTMVFVDPDFGPSAGELFDAARLSDGRPGAFLSALGAVTYTAHSAPDALVREAVQPYVAVVHPHGPPAPRPPQRRSRVLDGAAPRAVKLAARGRHAAAIRLLVRAARVLEGRGQRIAAAECMHQLGWIARSRGDSDGARSHFDGCARLATDHPLSLAATIGRAVVDTDEARLVEAEAALRGVVVAAESIHDSTAARRAAVALARTLLWQGRYDEASAVIEPALSTHGDASGECEAWALAARLRLLEGKLRNALDAARRAVDAASEAGSARHTCMAHRVMAAVLADAGDIAGVGEHVKLGLATARAAHLPLLALRLRITSVMAESSPGVHRSAGTIGNSLGAAPAGSRKSSAFSRTCLGIGIRRKLPQLLHWQVQAACGADVHQFVRETSARMFLDVGTRSRQAGELEAMLELSHSASDDRAAAEAICAHLCERLRATTVMIASGGPEHRVLMSAGKAWHGDAALVGRALASGRGIAPDAARPPQQAAEPVRCGGDVIAAMICRWTAGTAVNASAAEHILRAGALAAAGPVRALLDRTPPALAPAAWRDLLGESAAAAALRDAVARAARAPFPVLIEGESGSGKELVARAIHRFSARRDRRLCTVNCAAISEELLEAELFGHARGAFTGAVGERTGLFEEADGGTLLLDEVAELSPRAQAKLLRVLQDGEVRRVGENLPRRVDVRVIAATNRSLEQDAAAGRFRSDLRFRLDVVRIVVPPLRERAADIPLLAMHFWTEASGHVGSCASLSPDALAALARYDWPGNVRELQNVIAWMAVHSPRRGRIGPSALPAQLAQATAPASGSFDAARKEFERRFVRAALARAGGQRTRAAAALGVSRQGLAKMLRRLEIDAP